jgi:CubicO group peptidase (beta-lactamase class C family)
MAHGYRFASTAATARPVDLSAGGEIVPFASVVTAAAGAGGIAASAIDLARWARALYAGNALEERTVGTMVADVALTDRFRPSRAYGLGVVAVPVDGRATLGHSGRLLGAQSVMRWLPDEGVAIAVLTNQSRTDPAIIARALLKIALRPPDGCACVGVY